MANESRRLLHCSLLVGCSLFALALWTGPVAAQTDSGSDLLNQVRAANALKAQKLEGEVRDALKEADRVSQSDPALGASQLRRVLSKLEEDTLLDQRRREALVKSVKDRLRQLDADTGRADRQAPDKVTRISPRGEDSPRTKDEEAIERGMSAIRTLQQAGRDIEASRVAEDLARRYPGSVAPKTAGKIGAVNDRLADSRRLKEDRGDRYVVANRQIIESAGKLPINEVEFPDNWKELTARRSQDNKYTAKEKAIIKALDTPIPADFNKDRFQDVIEFLEKRTGQTFVLSEDQLKEETGGAFSYDAQVTLHARGVSLRTVLKRVLGEVGLTYVVRDEQIQIISQTRAREMMVTRSFYIADLAVAADTRFGPMVTQLQVMQNVSQLINLIQSTIEPSSWQVNGGKGAIAFDPLTMSIVIKQTAEIQAKFGGPFR